ncbi:tRNA (adenine(58)-N(1))-methyltransferase non-catalytic subunit TRM6 [Acipenser ruthenus]|uniref:tRNA (adenine(58)-N(1))-methyltransferase non-catalytic subunit TRM6 n=1 Tax=Acipenser ruthenus TaxID=7906 RepID=UPI002740840C|nr:tRNA (adenine(58)-N(1))-methyltransferase non-catalytic subunit TRM6 [Acipenser ruthenus]
MEKISVDHRTIKEGDYVVLKRENVFKAVQVQIKRKVIFEKQWLHLDSVIGQLYGTSFEVAAGGTLQAPKPNPEKNPKETKEAGMDNRNIVDDGRSQKLTRDDIETLKEQGLKGQEIVQQLIENSSTFRDKTEFAQEKYIKKKKKKYDNTITVLKPSTRILALMYHGREPGKICHLRYDTLAQMLTLGNVHAGSKIIVFDTCAGLVLGAVMERMGGYGSVIQMYPGGEPVRAATDNFGFPEHFYKTLHEFPLCKVNLLLDGTLSLDKDKKETVSAVDESNGAMSKAPQDSVQKMGEEVEGEKDSAQASPEVDTMEVTSELPEDKEKEERAARRENKALEKKVKQEEKRKKHLEAAALLQGRNADGLVIAGRFHPTPLVLSLLKFVAPSRPFVIYCQHKEPLIECHTKLRERGGVIGLQLSETWLRHYQVLPNRTHPMLLMSGGGGYILSGITVAMDTATSSGPQKTEEPAPKRQKLQDTES